MRRTHEWLAMAFVLVLLGGCGQDARGPDAEPEAPTDGPRMPVARMLWPPYVADVDPDAPGAQPGYAIAASDPEGDGDARTIRLSVVPGRAEDGSLIDVRSVHIQGPPGAPLAATEARVLPERAGWKAALSEDGSSCVMYAVGSAGSMPAEGLTLVLATSGAVLERAVWRDVKLTLRSDAAATVENASPDAAVGALYRGGDAAVDAVHAYALRLPYDTGSADDSD